MMFEDVPFFVWVIIVYFTLIFAYFMYTVSRMMKAKWPVRLFISNENPGSTETKQSDRFSSMFEKNGFVLYADNKIEHNDSQLLYERLFCSKNGDAIAVVTKGRSKNPMEVTIIVTRFDDGTRIRTINNERFAICDVLGLARDAVYEDLSPEEFLDHHDDRIEREIRNKIILPFDTNNPLKDFQNDFHNRVELIVSKGWAKYLDEEKTVWSYTFSGALRIMARMLLAGFRRLFFKDR